MTAEKIHRNLGRVKVVRGDAGGVTQVELPSGEIRSVDTSWLQDPPAPKPVVAAQTPPAPAPKPDAKAR